MLFLLFQLACFQLLGNYVVEVGPRRKSPLDPYPTLLAPVPEGTELMNYEEAVELVGRSPGYVFVEPDTCRVFAAGGQTPGAAPRGPLDAVSEDEPMDPAATGPRWSEGCLVQLGFEDLMREPFKPASAPPLPSPVVVAPPAATQVGTIIANPFVQTAASAPRLPRPSTHKKVIAKPARGTPSSSQPPAAASRSSSHRPTGPVVVPNLLPAGMALQQAAGAPTSRPPAKRAKTSEAAVETSTTAVSRGDASKSSAGTTSRSWGSRSSNSRMQDRSGGRRRPWTSQYGVRVTYDCNLPLMEEESLPRRPACKVRAVAVQAVPTTRCRSVSACPVGEDGEPEPQRPLLQADPPPKTTHRCSDKQLRLQKWPLRPVKPVVAATVAVADAATAGGSVAGVSGFLDVLRAELVARGAFGAGLDPGAALASVLADVTVVLGAGRSDVAPCPPAPVQGVAALSMDPPDDVVVVSSGEVSPASLVETTPVSPVLAMDVDCPSAVLDPADLEAAVREAEEHLLGSAMEMVPDSPVDCGAGGQDLLDEALCPTTGDDAPE